MNSSDFPVKVDLAMPAPEVALESPVKGKNSQPKPMYPSLYINNAEGLDGMPKEGYALIYYKRRRHSITEDDEGETHSADLEVQEICLPEKSSDDDMKDMGSELASMAKKRGINTGMETDEEESEESPEEEAGETEEEEAGETLTPKDEEEE